MLIVIILIAEMGAVNAVEDSLRENTESLWSNIPALPKLSALDFNLTSYNKSFVNFAVLVGALTLAHSTIVLGKKAAKVVAGKPKVPSKQQLIEKYGKHSYALIGDCKNCQDYCLFLANNGFNLILMGLQVDIDNTKALVRQASPLTLIEQIAVRWDQAQTSVQFYDDLTAKLQHHDISFLILPKLNQPFSVEPTHLEHIQPFQHVFLLVRYFGAKLKWRSYRSAIIFPSYPDVQGPIVPHNGTSKSLISGSDAFGRIIGYELKDTVEVVVARGTVEEAIRGLGRQRITN